jgi:hypothetical protein
LQDCTDFVGVANGNNIWEVVMSFFFHDDDNQMPSRKRRGLERVPFARQRRDFPGAEQILYLLERIEASQEKLWLLGRSLSYLLSTGLDPDDDELDPVDVVALQKGWNGFVRAGGVTADDLRAFLHGHPIGSQVRVKKHLRLVTNNQKPQRRTRAINGHDAA